MRATDGWMDRWMDGWMDRWMDGWMMEATKTPDRATLRFIGP